MNSIYVPGCFFVFFFNCQRYDKRVLLSTTEISIACTLLKIKIVLHIFIGSTRAV